MSYEKKWNILADMLIELQEKGEKTPKEIMKDLRSAKTIIQVLKADPAHTESVSRIETYLRNVESYVIFTAEKLGTKTVETWLEMLKDKVSDKVEEQTEQNRFVVGVPRDQNWIRIQITEETPLKIIKNLVKKNKLSCTTQEDGYVIVYGEKNNIKSLVKTIAERFRGSRNDRMGV